MSRVETNLLNLSAALLSIELSVSWSLYKRALTNKGRWIEQIVEYFYSFIVLF